MDRIDAMDTKEKDAALRELIAAVSISYGPMATQIPDSRRITRALAAFFEPKPIDIACKALEDAGFAKVRDLAKDGDVWVSAIGRPGLHYRLTKE